SPVAFGPGACGTCPPGSGIQGPDDFIGQAFHTQRCCAGGHDGVVFGYGQYVMHATGLQTMPQLVVGTIHGVTGGPLGLDARIQGTANHRSSQFWFSVHAPMIGNPGLGAAVRVIDPCLGDIEFSVYKGASMLGGVGQKYPDLAILDSACRPGILPGHPSRGSTVL